MRNKFPEIEDIVNTGQPVYLTKNGYGAMVVLSLAEYAAVTSDIEMKLDGADKMAKSTEERYTHQQIFGNARKAINGR